MAEAINASKDQVMQDSKNLHQAINAALKNEQGGTKVHVFNPDMSAEQKKAEVLKDVSVPSLPNKTTPLHTDIGSTDTKKVVDAINHASPPSVRPASPPPTPPNQQTASVITPETVNHSTSDKSDQGKAPGSFVDEPVNKKIPDWYNVGWTNYSSLPNPGDEKAMAEMKKSLSDQEIKEHYYRSRSSNGEYNDFITQFINEKYYGEWYHNCGVVFVAIFFTWLLIKIRFGLFSCLFVGAFFATYYRTSIKRTRRNARDDMQRQVSLNRLETDAETVGWMNLFLSRFWLIFEPVLSAQVIEQVDALLVENTPAFLDSIRLSTFTLGTKAPRVEGVKVYPSSAPDVICMDWKVSFIPNDVIDITQREMQNKVNPKIVLTIRVGKGMLGAGAPILLEDIAFSGLMRIKLKLFNEMPHVKTAEVSFLEKPHFDYVLKPVGGDTFGFDINNIPGLESFVKDQVHSNLGPMMYAPNVFTLDVAAMMGGGIDLDSANGVLAVTIYSAQGLKANDIFGSLDPYCTFKVGDILHPELGRTSAIENDQNPKWNETHFLLLNNLNDILCFEVLDRNVGRKDVEIGVATMNLKEVDENQNAIEDLNLTVLRSGKPVGEIKADVRWFPVSKPDKKEDDTIITPVESNSGVVRFSILDCQDIGAVVTEKKGGVPLIGGLPVVSSVPGIGSQSCTVNSYAIVKVNGQEKLRTSTYKRSANPRWNKFVEVFVADKANMNLEVDIMNAGFGEDTLIGRWSSSLTNMEKQLVEEKNDWWNLQGGTGKIHLDMTWKPVPLTGFSAGLTRGDYRHPVGVVRVKLNHAKGLKNVEAFTSKSDPYVRVMSGMQPRGQTEAILDSLDPIWDTALYVPVHSLREDLLLEVMDYNDVTDDKFLGMCDLLIKDLAIEKKTEDDQSIYEGLPAIQRNAELLSQQRKPDKGQLNFEACFFPTLALAKQATKEELEAKAKEGADTAIADDNDKKDNESEKAVAAEPLIPTGPSEKDLHGESVRYTENQKFNLLAYESGVLSVNIHQVTLPTKENAVVEILVDANDAQFRTTNLKGTTLNFQESGDAFVKEMDFSRLVVRVRDVKSKNENERIGFWTSPVQDIVSNIQNRAAATAEGQQETDDVQEYRLLGCAGGMIRLSFKFLPVIQFKLDPSESLENQGNLNVTVISASGLRAADKSGTSDPFCVFSVNGEKVYKTQTYKKQLNPVFKNEKFIAPILQRTKAELMVKIYDWDQVGNNELLAEGPIPISDLESFAGKEVTVPLRGGKILLLLKWEPQLLARKRQGTILGATTRIFTAGPADLAGNVVGAGGKVISGGGKVVGGSAKVVGGAIGGGIGAIGGGIGAIGRGIGKIGSRKSISENQPTVGSAEQADNAAPVVIAPGATQPIVTNINGAAVPAVMPDGANSQTLTSSSNDSLARPRSVFDDKEKNATIKITLLGARGLKGANSYVRVRLGKHTIHKTKHLKKTADPEWNDTFTTKVFGSSVLILTVRDHHTLTDSDIGDVQFHVAENVDDGKAFDGWLPLSPSGNGELHIQCEVVTQ